MPFFRIDRQLVETDSTFVEADSAKDALMDRVANGTNRTAFSIYEQKRDATISTLTAEEFAAQQERHRKLNSPVERGEMVYGVDMAKQQQKTEALDVLYPNEPTDMGCL